MISVVKLLLKGEIGVCALNSHGNYIADHGKSWKNHGIVFLNFCGNPAAHLHRLIKAFVAHFYDKYLNIMNWLNALCIHRCR